MEAFHFDAPASADKAEAAAGSASADAGVQAGPVADNVDSPAESPFFDREEADEPAATGYFTIPAKTANLLFESDDDDDDDEGFDDHVYMVGDDENEMQRALWDFATANGFEPADLSYEQDFFDNEPDCRFGDFAAADAGPGRADSLDAFKADIDRLRKLIDKVMTGHTGCGRVGRSVDVIQALCVRFSIAADRIVFQIGLSHELQALRSKATKAYFNHKDNAEVAIMDLQQALTAAMAAPADGTAGSVDPAIGQRAESQLANLAAMRARPAEADVLGNVAVSRHIADIQSQAGIINGTFTRLHEEMAKRCTDRCEDCQRSLSESDADWSGHVGLVGHVGDVAGLVKSDLEGQEQGDIAMITASYSSMAMALESIRVEMHAWQTGRATEPSAKSRAVTSEAADGPADE